jgi:transposase
MFVKVTRSGPRQYVQLAEAYRDATGRVRHRHVANLGRLEEASAKLASLVDGLCRVTGRPSLEGAEFERAREVGGTWVLTELWNRLGLSRTLRGLVRDGAKLDIDALTRVMVFNRLCEPDSKLGILAWLKEVVVPGVDPAEVTHQRLLRVMDVLETHLARIMTRLSGLIRPLLDQTVTLVFYDLTTLRAQGECRVPGDLRAFGQSKDTEGLARQVQLGVVQSGCGLPLDFELFPGNVAEVSTLVPMIERCVKRFPLKQVVLVADRGLLSLEQIEALEALSLPKGVSLSWILAVPARRYGDFIDPVLKCIRAHADATDPWVDETESAGHRIVLTRDPVTAAALTAARRQRIDAIEADAEAAAQKLDRQDLGKNERGRRATDRGAYLRFREAVKAAHLSKILSADLKADRFSWSLDDDALARQETLDGTLVLLTNLKSHTPAQVVEHYKQLADIERGFRVLKSEIEMAPIYHRLPERIRAHGLICFLALLLHRVMRPKLTNHSPASALRALRALQLHTLKKAGGTLTGVSTVDTETQAIFTQLDLPLPDPARL